MPRLLLLVLCGLLVSFVARAQHPMFFAKTIAAYPDLKFPETSQALGTFTSVSNGIFRPEGEGPFPAVVLVHTCGGIEPHITERAKELLQAGFLVLVLDSYAPRNHRNFCMPGGVGSPRLYKDAYDALAHLSQLKEVDAQRIYLVGLSLGSFAAAVASSPEVAGLVGSSKRFRASVGWYGSCAFDVSPSPKWELIRPDVDRPVLLLLAGKDDETPINECFPRLDKLKAEGRPVYWHIYDDATHAWDKSNARRGYVYNRAVTADAMQKTVDFLRKN